MASSQQQTEEDKEAERSLRVLIDFAANTKENLYGLLELSSDGSAATDSDGNLTLYPPTEIRRAWRQTALKHHPDKNRGKEKEAGDRLDVARRAWEVLSTPQARTRYDERLRAEKERKEREGKLGERRKRMKKDLETRERGGVSLGSGAGLNGVGGNPIFGGSRSAGNGEDAETREKELQRLSAEGARRRRERAEEARKRKAQDEEDLQAAREAVAAKKKMKDLNGEGRSTNPNQGGTSQNGTSKLKFTPKTPAGADGNSSTSGTNGPAKGASLYESTMARLKEMEKKRQEASMKKKDSQGSQETTNV